MTERRKMKKPENVWFLLGALAVLAMGIPYLILGKDAIFCLLYTSPSPRD